LFLRPGDFKPGEFKMISLDYLGEPTGVALAELIGVTSFESA